MARYKGRYVVWLGKVGEGAKPEYNLANGAANERAAHKLVDDWRKADRFNVGSVLTEDGQRLPVREAHYSDGRFKARAHYRVVNRMTGASREGSFDTKAEAVEAARTQNRYFGGGWVATKED